MQILSIKIDNTNVTKRDFILMLCIIIISTETLMFGTTSNGTFLAIRSFFNLSFLPLCLLHYKNNVNSNNLKPAKTALVLMIFLFSISGIISGELGLQYIYRMIIMAGGFYYAFTTPIKKFLNIFVIVMLFIATYSLIIALLNTIVPGLFAFFPTIVNSGGYVYHNMIFTVIPENAEIIRLHGPFREPGVFVVYLSIALIIYLKQTKLLSLYVLVIFVTAIILSYSTTGYVVLNLIILYFIFKENIVEKRYIKCWILLLAAVVFGYLYLHTGILADDGIVLGKLNNENNASRLSREASIFVNLDIIKSNYLFGVGIQHSFDIFKQYAGMIFVNDVSDNTNMWLQICAMHGIPFGFIFALGLFRFCMILSDNLQTLLFAVTGVFLLFCGETMIENILIYILIGYGFCYKKIELNQEKVI